MMSFFLHFYNRQQLDVDGRYWDGRIEPWSDQHCTLFPLSVE